VPARILLLAISLVVAACSSEETAPTTTEEIQPPVTQPAAPEPEPVGGGEGQAIPPATTATLRNQVGFVFPPAPAVPTGPPTENLAADIDALFGNLATGVDRDALEGIGRSEDTRAAWLLSDLLRFLRPGDARDAAVAEFERLTETDLGGDPIVARNVWQSATDHLIAWDLPALPGYREWKAQLFTIFDPRWAPFFEDEDAAIDWRPLSWGGVLLDDRPLGDPNPCPRGCIPALDDPAVTDAAGGGWYPDERLVFGLTIDGESRAYPKHIMEVHEMVNDTLGGRRIGIPYCTLCGSAQAYFTDSVPAGVEVPVLRTSGLLTRSNKVMFDLNTFSVFDTFTGEAVSGPLHDEGITLEQTSVVTSTWGEWKLQHPDTTIVAEDEGLGHSHDLDPLRGRDDAGPIFPIGDVDQRLPVQEQVLGVFADDGTAIAFPVAQARAELDAGRAVRLLGIELHPDGSGVRATRTDASEVVGHQAFWFAWSQFHPETVVWAPAGG
jgi:hypothetical protein